VRDLCRAIAQSALQKSGHFLQARPSFQRRQHFLCFFFFPLNITNFPDKSGIGLNIQMILKIVFKIDDTNIAYESQGKIAQGKNYCQAVSAGCWKLRNVCEGSVRY
jgi:hypothetical protein